GKQSEQTGTGDLSDGDQTFLQGVIYQLRAVAPPVAEFVAGCVYQYIYDQGGAVRWVLQLFPEWRELETGVEEELPDSWAFELGRNLGDGAAVIQGIAEFSSGSGAAFGGTLLCFSGFGCIGGAPAAVVGVAVAGHGASVAVEGTQNLSGRVVEQLAKLGVVLSVTNGEHSNGEEADSISNQQESPKTENKTSTNIAAQTPDGWVLSNHAALDSLARHGVTLRQVDDIVANYSRKVTQADGATVFIKVNKRGRKKKYSVVILNERTRVIVTGMRDLEGNQLRALGRNYGFNPDAF
ncbi:MAG: hypothetical protein F6K24_51205, partial [Okeania sp. SIO2D1]|nr:hypothetical protein [Okeania sp. SIO2D1]